MDKDNGYSHAYPIEILARNPIVFDEPALVAALAKRLGRVKPGEIKEADKLRLYFLEDFPVTLKDGSIPAQIALFSPDHKASSAQRSSSVEQALQQSWAFPGAGKVLKECSHSLMFTNFMSSPLSHDVRRKIIANGLLAVLETTTVDLLFWTPTQQMVSPADVRSRYSDPQEWVNPVYGFLNVRFFNIENSQGDKIMDTLGLNALGLTDFQIHYRGLESNSVARQLYNLGAYAFEKGDVIQDGHTVEGITKGSRWKCRREVSLLEPRREVLDINPGAPFAAGNRKP